MKILFKYILLVTFLLGTLFYNIRFTYLVSFYTLNNESFTELFCENQDKPEMQCNGKCAITKASQDLNQEKNDLVLNSFQKEITFFVQVNLPEKIFITNKNGTSQYRYLNEYSFLFIPYISHPPIRIS
ncbi:hypothetical protein [Salinimicrobium sp. GXAS 041]|uniref:hypothetical protein n=1 Tax=Salinimicrobium sp. GXAS 041 TaxID=3400806 RepID=UPI003C76C560